MTGSDVTHEQRIAAEDFLLRRYSNVLVLDPCMIRRADLITMLALYAEVVQEVRAKLEKAEGATTQ